MPERRLSGRLMVLGFGLIIALALALPAWAAAADTTTSGTPATVSGAPTPVGVNASIVFSGNGFDPNEFLSVWITAPDGTSMVLPGSQADANGGFSVTVSFSSTGQWQATAHSIASGKEVTGTYAVGATTTTTTSPVTGTAPTDTSASGTAAPGALPAGIGAPVTFSDSGFTANETISLWETAPDNKVTSLPQTQADGNGAFSASVTFPSAGQWQVTAQGVTSGKKVIRRYAVGTTTSTTTGSVPVTSATSSNGQGFSNAPPVTLGSAVTFSGSGFNSGETLSLWQTPPDGSPPTALPGATADGTGAFTTSVTFPSVGNWQVTAHGRDSAHEVIGRYTVTSDASATTPSSTAASTVTAPNTGAPIKTTTSTVITFIPTGYTPGETVSVWSTAPDTSVTKLDDVVASSTGRAIITVSFASEGLWQITAHGRDSGREVIGQYQVAAKTP